MTQPGEPSSSSNTEHRLQKGFEHKIQQYPVSRKHEEHISLAFSDAIINSERELPRMASISKMLDCG